MTMTEMSRDERRALRDEMNARGPKPLLPGEVAFGDEDATVTDSRSQYSKNSARAADRSDTPTGTGGSKNTGGSKSGASDKQRSYITSLAAERGLEVKAQWLASKASASAAIDTLLATPKTVQVGSTTLQVHHSTPATEKQITFVRTLLAEREGVPAAEAIRTTLNEARLVAPMTAALVSECITALLEIPKPSNAPTVPDGRYALAADDGHFVFYKVSTPTEGRWAGRTFVVQLLGSVGSWAEQRLADKVAASVRTRIAEDTEEAARMFGIKAEACGYCGSPLSNLQSRAAGYGETCAHKHGFFYPTEAEAREILRERGVEIEEG